MIFRLNVIWFIGIILINEFILILNNNCKKIIKMDYGVF